MLIEIHYTIYTAGCVGEIWAIDTSWPLVRISAVGSRIYYTTFKVLGLTIYSSIATACPESTTRVGRVIMLIYYCATQDTAQCSVLGIRFKDDGNR